MSFSQIFVSLFKRKPLDLKDIPFDESVRLLNSGYYLHTFEQVGSVKIDPVSWPTKLRKKAPTKFEGSNCSLKKKSTDQVQGIEKKQSVVPSVKVPNKMISAPKETVTPTLTKEEEKDVNGKVKKMINKVSISNSPKDLHSEESKLECTKRKLRQQYEQIENEKKKRRIQIIDLPPPAEMQKKQRKRRR